MPRLFPRGDNNGLTDTLLTFPKECLQKQNLTKKPQKCKHWLFVLAREQMLKMLQLRRLLSLLYWRPLGLRINFLLPRIPFAKYYCCTIWHIFGVRILIIKQSVIVIDATKTILTIHHAINGGNYEHRNKTRFILI